MKWILVAAAMLVASGGVFDAAWACEACAPQKGMELAKASNKSEATVTLVVRGMMKRKSGAT